MNQVEVKKRQIKSFSYIIGCIGILLLGKLLGNSGIAYLAAGYECYSFFFILLGSNVPDALGRMLKGRSAKGQYRNAARVRRYVMLFQVFLGIVGSVFLALLGNFVIRKLFFMPRASYLSMVLVPAFFLRMVSAVLQGYLQGEGDELPAAGACLLRQILFVSLGFVFGNLLKGYGVKVGALLGQEDFAAMYAAMGVAAAIGIAELLTGLFLVTACRISRRKAKNDAAEGMRITDSFGRLVSILYGNMLWGILVQIFARLPIWLGIIFLQKRAAADLAVISSYGEYYGKYLAAGAVVVFFTDILLISASSKVYVCLKRDEWNYAKTGFQGGLHLAAVQGLYFGAFLMAVSSQLAGFLSGTTVGEATQNLATMIGNGAFTVCFLIVAGYFARLLILGKSQHLVVAGLGIMNVLFIISTVLFLNSGNMGALSLVYAGLIASAALCAVLGFFACKQLGMGIDWIQTLVLPAGGACICGLISMFLGKALTPHLGNITAILICFALSYLLYWILLIFLRNFREQELKMIPGGNLIKSFGKILQIY
ncbi:MAG: hypothetical protein NC126_08750 [Clostridium sp.]|nr:hypothetical protein [Clostridium sp.]